MKGGNVGDSQKEHAPLAVFRNGPLLSMFQDNTAHIIRDSALHEKGYRRKATPGYI